MRRILMILAMIAPGTPAVAADRPEPIRRGEVIEDAASSLAIRVDRGAVTGLQRIADVHPTDYIAAGGRFGDLVVKWRTGGGPWQAISTAELAEAGLLEGIPPAPGRPGSTVWGAAGGAGPRIATRLEFREKGLTWTISLGNPTAEPIEIGGLAFSCPMSTDYVWDREVTYHQRVIRHASISGQGSWIYWMRCDATPPLLLLTPLLGTGLEYFDAVPRKGVASRPYTVYIHSASEKEVLAEKGTRWRQAATSVVLAPRGTPGDSASYGFRLSWADSIEDVRRRLVEDGLVDVQAMPGMTVPLDLQARIALRSREPIRSVEAEFPRETELRRLDSDRPGVSLWSLRFRRLGENLLTLRWGEGRAMVLEFFVTEPLETLVRKRARFLGRSQHRDPSKWYDGLITDWNLRDRVLLSPDALSTVPESRRYMVTCDDPGLGKPAFLAAKNAEFPEPAEIEALEYYIGRFLWGGLQRTDAEHHPFGVYGIPDWKRNRESTDEGTKGKLHIWRIYDYPHVVMLYLHMSRIARWYPGTTRVEAGEYLRRAHGTALAYYTYPLEIEKWSPYGTGTYNELVIEELIGELDRWGQADRAKELRAHWDRKVEFFAAGRANLFGSEYPFDSTGFESTHSFARYALRQAASGGGLKVTGEEARRFLENQIRLNINCRGWLEPAYYLLGSDIRAGGSAHYTLSYMTPMGGWAVLDYALHHAADPQQYLPLGYASILASWALLNSGTPESGYGYWFPGPENDGGAGGGFEPAPYGRTWLGQSHSRGSWSYACESDLGFGGFLRAAATVLADDPIFGTVAYGGLCERAGDGWKVWCRDGVRRRLHLLRGALRAHLELERDHFDAAIPVEIDNAATRLRFTIESPSMAPHSTVLVVSGLPRAAYRVTVDGKQASEMDTRDGREARAAIRVEGPRAEVALEAK